MSDDVPISSVVRIVDALREELAAVLGKNVKKTKHDPNGFPQQGKLAPAQKRRHSTRRGLVLLLRRRRRKPQQSSGIMNEVGT